jgi:hypothetical protein
MDACVAATSNYWPTIGLTLGGTGAMVAEMKQMAYALWVLALWNPNAGVSAEPKTWHGGWTANVGNGDTVFTGTWDAEESEKTDLMSGNWTLSNGAGRTVATGTWAARKNQRVWTGDWQARNAQGGVSSGTWRAQLSLSPAQRFVEMFHSAASGVVNGTWRMGAASAGSWAIRVFTE